MVYGKPLKRGILFPGYQKGPALPKRRAGAKKGLNLMDFTGTAAAAGLAGLIVSLINCLFGFRLQKFWVGVVCFLFGGTALSLVASHLTQTAWVHVAAFFVGGAALAAVSFRLYLASLFVFSLGLVWLTAYWLIPTAWLGHVAGLVLGVLAGVLVTKLTRPAIILLTAATGGFSAAKSAFLLAGADTQASNSAFWAMAAVGLAAFVLGAVFQFRSTKA